MLYDKIRQLIASHGMVSRGDKGAVAFSGGNDSLCLLHLFSRLSKEWDFGLIALHVDHGLRIQSAQEAKDAVNIAQSMGIEVQVLEAQLGSHISGNVQKQARSARLKLLAQAAHEHNLNWIALAHTGSDQAETLLMRMSRGSGLRGLACMSLRRGLFIRPLLYISREAIDEYLHRHKLAPVLDPTNASDKYLRNRIRHDVIPLLHRENPSIIDTLCRVADNCREEHSALESWAQKVLNEAKRRASDSGQPLQRVDLQMVGEQPGHRHPMEFSCDGRKGPRTALIEKRDFIENRLCLHEPRCVRVDLRSLRDLPKPILQRVFRLAYEEASRRPGLERKHFESLNRLIQTFHGTQSLDLPGIRCERSYGTLRFYEEISTKPSMRTLEIHDLGRYPLGDGRLISLAHGPISGPLDPLSSISKQNISFPLRVRAIKQGDRVRIGHTTFKKVSRVLIDAKIQKWLRPFIPIVECQGEVVLVVGIRCAYGFFPVQGEPTIQIQLFLE